MSQCTLANGCEGCKTSIEHNLMWILRNKPERLAEDRHQLNLAHVKAGHGSPELQALVKEMGL